MRLPATRTRAPILPQFVTTVDEMTPEEVLVAEAEELARQARDGLQARLDRHGVAGDTSEQDYWDRLDYELGIITNMKFPGYFLIVADFIQWAKAQGIPVGAGSWFGSGVCRCLGIDDY